jgi:MFS family permease
MMSGEIHQRRARRTVVLLNIATFFRHAVFVVAILVPFFERHIGLTFREFLATESMFAATVVLMEVPSGWLADKWRRKSAICVGAAVCALGVWFFIPADSFALAALAQILMGIGISLMSGADSALLYDALADAGEERHYRAIEGRRHGWGMFAVAFASVSGAAMFAIDPLLPVWAMVGSCLLVCACGLLIDEPKREAIPATGTVDWRQQLGTFAIVAAAAAMFGASSVGMWLQQPYWSDNGIPEIGFGLLMTLGFAVGGLAGRYGHHLDRWIGAAPALAVLWIVLTAAYAGAGKVSGYPGIALLLVGSAAWGTGFPLLQALINGRVSSAYRATVLSCVNLAIKLVFIPLSTFIGWLTAVGSTASGALGLAVWLLFSGVAAVVAVCLMAQRRPAKTA